MRRALRRAPSVLAALAFAAFTVGLATVWIAGWRAELVLTSSMEPEVPRGALALTRPVPAGRVDVGDVVSYFDPDRPAHPVLHRVTDVLEQGGSVFFRFQGDANPAPDPLLVPDDRIENRLVWHVPRVGHVVAWLAGPWQRWLLVAVPLALALDNLRRQRRARTAAPAVRRCACFAPKPRLVLRPVAVTSNHKVGFPWHTSVPSSPASPAPSSSARESWPSSPIRW